MTGKKRHILVTGANRSGTTWVGKMLQASGELKLVYEPFNIAYQRQHGRTPPLKHHFHYVLPEESREVKRYIHKLIRPPAQPFSKRLDVHVKRWIKTNVIGIRALFKDPIALFSAPWFAEQLNCQVTVMVRHPAAYVGSIKRVGWRSDPRKVLEQAELVKRYLGGLRGDLEAFRRTENNLVEEAVLRWRTYHTVIAAYQQEYPYLFVRHEDLCEDPVSGFRRVYDALSLPYGNDVEAAIRESTEAAAAVSQGDDVHVLDRDSKQVTKQWKKQLSPAEIDYVKLRTEDLAARFYDASDW